MSTLTDSLYRLEDGRVIPTENVAGPWDPGLQHGGGPAALVAWTAESIPTAVPMRTTRITIDLLRPVSISPLEIQSNVIREGKKIQLCEVRLRTNGVDVVRASVLKVRSRQLALPNIEMEEPLDLPLPEAGEEPSWTSNTRRGFISGVSLREVKGGFRKPGPAAIWYRINWPVIDGQPPSPLMRAAITADFGNGTSSALDFAKWTFINGDLTISLSRLPVGDWILQDSRTSLSHSGVAIARGRLADRQGYFGVAVQSVIVEPR